jgi:hypothetical protein
MMTCVELVHAYTDLQYQLDDQMRINEQLQRECAGWATAARQAQTECQSEEKRISELVATIMAGAEQTLVIALMMCRELRDAKP